MFSNLDSVGLQFACVFSRNIWTERVAMLLGGGFMTNCVLHMFSCVFSMLVMLFVVRLHFAHVFLSKAASPSVE